MDDRPGYGCYLAHQYKRFNPYQLIVCKKGGQVSFFEETNKKNAVRTILKILLFLFSLSPLTIAFFLINRTALIPSWFSQIDFYVLALASPFLISPLVCSLDYWFCSFRSVSPEKAEEMRAEFLKTALVKKDPTVIPYIACALLIFMFWISLSFTGAFLRYALDTAAHNTANRPRAEASVSSYPLIIRLDASTSVARGHIPDEKILIDIDVIFSNTPDDAVVLLNGSSIRPYLHSSQRFSCIWNNAYFEQCYNYKIPASLFKPTNTLHVECGLAKGNWTIEITPREKQ